MVVADKGFLISDILPKGVTLNIPPFLDSVKQQFTVSEVQHTNLVAKQHIHVERVISRIKNYRILDHIPATLFSKANVIIKVCAALINFQNPVLAEVANIYRDCNE